MPPENRNLRKPRTFFLNEKQELGSFERDGGGRQADYVSVDWSARSSDLTASFRQATAATTNPKDPSVERHFFMIAVPAADVQKHSQAKGIPEGIKHEVPAFGGEQSRLFRKLGMDLVETLPDGRATVHVPAVRTQQLVATMASLPDANSREKARWINFDGFEPLVWTSRVWPPWVESLPPREVTEVAIRFQPALTRVEVNDVLRAMTRVLEGTPSRLTKAGREFSGRYWAAGALTRESILAIARDFVSVQSIHPQIQSEVAARSKGKPARTVHIPVSKLPLQPIEDLPTVAIVDCGIPEAHVHLAPYRRSGFRNPNLDVSDTYFGNHGSHVASCAVFGRLDMNAGLSSPPPGRCRVIDVMVGT